MSQHTKKICTTYIHIKKLEIPAIYPCRCQWASALCPLLTSLFHFSIVQLHTAVNDVQKMKKNILLRLIQAIH